MASTRFILGSSSPRRHELLTTAGFDFDIVAPDVDETPGEGESPIELVERLARLKSEAIAADRTVLTADTVVFVDGAVLGKPVNQSDAARMLRLLSGRRHHVSTGVAVRGANMSSFVVTTAVDFAELSAVDIDRYVLSGEPMGKAGAYAIQGRGAGFVTRLDGSYTNVVGLPLAETIAALGLAGIMPDHRQPDA